MPPGMNSVNSKLRVPPSTNTTSYVFAAAAILLSACASDLRPAEPVVLRIEKADVPGNPSQPTVFISLPGPLDPLTVTRRSAFWVAGSLASRTTVQYRPSRLELALFPDRPLESGLEHTLQLQPGLRLADGRSLPTDDPVTLDDAHELPVSNRQIDTEAAVNAAAVTTLLQQRCGSCHNDQPLFAFTTVTLYEPSISDPRRPRVDPFEPGRSVLLERVIPGFPRLSGQTMPPDWSDQPGLTLDEVRSIEEWILNGAPR